MEKNNKPRYFICSIILSKLFRYHKGPYGRGTLPLVHTFTKILHQRSFFDSMTFQVSLTLLNATIEKGAMFNLYFFS